MVVTSRAATAPDLASEAVLSCFDPVRREVARQALELLLKD